MKFRRLYLMLLATAYLWLGNLSHPAKARDSKESPQIPQAESLSAGPAETRLEAIESFGEFFRGKAELLSRGNDKVLRALAVSRDDMKPWDILTIGDFLIFNPERADEAATHLKEVIRLHQNSTYAVALATFDLALQQSFGSKDFKGAATKLFTIDDLPMNAIQDSATFFRALYLILAGDIAGGVSTFDKVSKKISGGAGDPCSSGIFDDARFLKGIFRAWILEDPRGASEDFKCFLSDYPGSPLTLLATSNLAKAAFVSGNIVLAESLLSRAAATGESPDAELLLATLHAGDPEEIKHRAEMIASREKVLLETMVGEFKTLAAALGAKEADAGKALALFAERHQESPLVPLGMFIFGARLAGEGKIDLSRRILAETAGSWKGFPCSDMASYRAWWSDPDLKGYARFTALEALGAEAVYLPYRPLLTTDLVLELFLHANQPDATVPYAEALGKAGPEFKHIEQFMLGILAFRNGNLEGALKLMETNIELYFLSPFTDDSLFLRGEILSKEKVPGISRHEAVKEAAKIFSRLMGEHPRSPYVQKAREKMESLSAGTGR